MKYEQYEMIRGRFWKHVEDFSSQCSLRVVDNMLPAVTFTFLSSCHNSTSWLDHALCGMDIPICPQRKSTT